MNLFYWLILNIQRVKILDNYLEIFDRRNWIRFQFRNPIRRRMNLIN